MPYSKHSAPGLLGAVVERCTELRPDKRFKSIGALRGALSTILTAQDNPTPSPSAQDWMSSVKNNQINNPENFESFIRYLNSEASSDDVSAIFTALDDESLSHLFTIDEGHWSSLVTNLCEWVTDTPFEFSFCDALAPVSYTHLTLPTKA